ncbi:MAG TPA: polysaccharide biosynthesis C-terminal domain-containing protein [Vineibacter sp.]|nr:polysaccharide biosynthesis C-terminal domain-containing protein [Vineibacter sp.]
MSVARRRLVPQSVLGNKPVKSLSRKAKRANSPKSLAGATVLRARYRDFIDAVERYVGASIDQKPISLFTIVVVGGGGVAMRALGMALMFAAHLAMAWFSTPSDLGSYFILIGLTNIAATAGSLGLAPAAVRFVPAFAAQQRSDFQAGYTYATLKVTAAVTLLVSGAALLVAAIFQHEMTRDLHVGLSLFAILLPLMTLQFVSLDLLRAFGLPLQGQTVTSFLPPVLVVGGAIVASQFGQLSFPAMGSIACVSAALTAIVQLYSLRRLILRRLVGVIPQSELFNWIRVSLPIMASALVFISALSIDWLVVASLTNVAQSAIYRVCLYLLTIQGVVDTTFYGVVGAYISRNYHRQDKEEYQAFVRKLNAMQMLATFAVFLVLFCAAGPILAMYGPDFVAGTVSLQILAATWLIRSSLGPQEMLLNIVGRERTVTMVHVLAVVLSLVFSLTLVPVYGMTGAAMAHAIAWGGTGVLMYLVIARQIGLRVALHHLLGAWLLERIRHGNFVTRPLKAILEPVLMTRPRISEDGAVRQPVSRSTDRCSHRPLSQVFAEYALQEILFAARFIATEKGLRLLHNTQIRVVPGERVRDARGPEIILPSDISPPLTPQGSRRIPFNGTFLTLFNPLPQPGDEWQALPNEAAPAWWRHPTGTLTPAWNMLGNVYDLLTFREDEEIAARDRHGRLPAVASVRTSTGFGKVPVANEALALLLDASAAMEQGVAPTFRLDGLIEAPALVLSHDCDLLRGDDSITQAIRAYRIFQPCFRGRAPRLGLLGKIFANYRHPYRYFLDDLIAMLAVERRLGYRSVMYVLNGTGGRFGARSGLAAVRKLLQRVPAGWEIGIHYNYDTFHQPARFAAQKAEIETLIGRTVTAGRAHYLRFDPRRSPAFVAERGIRFDESIGWSSQNGYKAGIAAPFRPLNEAVDTRLDVIELPLVFMDSSLAEGEDGYQSFKDLFGHLEKIGGVISLLFHPGTFANPERPDLKGLYLRILEFATEARARNLMPSDIMRIAAESAVATGPLIQEK